MSRPGIYVHIPYCRVKCPYCSFYSLSFDGGAVEDYVNRIVDCIRLCDQGRGEGADTLYFGGGTPGLLSPSQVKSIINAVDTAFLLYPDTEITLEINPGDADEDKLRAFLRGGVNRLSVGVQSLNDSELCKLGRRHDFKKAEEAVLSASAAGFENISVDIMLGIPGQTPDTLKETLCKIRALPVTHVSAYILKVERDTPFYGDENRFQLPSEDETADLYLLAAQELSRAGFCQYEISNFAVDGLVSRHNIKYWNCDPYIGFGPSAHSLYGGRRFYYENSLPGFMSGAAPVQDGTGGDFSEYAMLRLRLAEGLVEESVKGRFGHGIPVAMRVAAEKIPAHMIESDGRGIRITGQGFLLSNEIIVRLIKEL